MGVVAVLTGLACHASPGADDSAAQRSSATVKDSTVDSSSTPTQLVTEYVTRDSRGDRLGSNPWFLKVVTWPDDPGYDSYTLITGFDVSPVALGPDTARIRVTYRTAAWITAGDATRPRVIPHDSAESQLFTVVRKGGRWLIDSPQLDQHVLPAAALSHSQFDTHEQQQLEALAKTVASPPN
jgi:hypothetical protein